MHATFLHCFTQKVNSSIDKIHVFSCDREGLSVNKPWIKSMLVAYPQKVSVISWQRIHSTGLSYFVAAYPLEVSFISWQRIQHGSHYIVVAYPLYVSFILWWHMLHRSKLCRQQTQHKAQSERKIELKLKHGEVLNYCNQRFRVNRVYGCQVSALVSRRCFHSNIMSEFVLFFRGEIAAPFLYIHFNNFKRTQL